jgi:hypothetical protein
MLGGRFGINGHRVAAHSLVLVRICAIATSQADMLMKDRNEGHTMGLENRR